MKSYKLPKKIILYTLLIFGLMLTLLPFLWMVSTSLKSSESIFTYPPQWIPKNATLQWYRDLVVGMHFLQYFKNSFIIACITTIINVFLSSLSAYAFAKLRFFGRDKLFTVLLASLMIPAQVTMIPVFLILKWMGLLNSYWGLILPTCINIYGIFLVREYMISIPDDLIESARIDGCSDFRIYWSIILPFCGPILATLTILTFMTSWNDFFLPLIVMLDEKSYTLPIALANLQGQHGPMFGLLMAAAVIVIAPVLALFAVAQKFVIRSIATAGLKE